MPTDPAPPPPLDYRNPTHQVTVPHRSNALRILAWTTGICLALLFLSCLFPSLGRARETSQRIKCASNLKQIGNAAYLYADANHGLLPPDLCVIQSDYDISPHTLTCPSRDLDPASGTTPAAINASILSGDHLGYAWVGAGLSLDHLPNDAVLAFDLERHTPKDAARTTGINVLLADGSVTFVTEPTAKSIHAQFAAGLRPIRLPAAPSATTQPTPNQQTP